MPLLPVPPEFVPGQLLSEALARQHLRSCGKGVKIYKGSRLVPPHLISIGDFSQIDEGVHIFAGEGIEIGRHVHFALGCSVTGGGTCIVRIVHSLFADTDDWDGQLEGTESGWPGFFRILRIYLTHFRGRRSANLQWIAPAAGTVSEAWKTLTTALGLQGASRGDIWTAPAGVPALGGVVEHIGQNPSHALIRLDTPGPGVAALGAVNFGGTMVTLSFYLYGDQAAATAARETPHWDAWIQERFPTPAEPLQESSQ